MGTMMQGCITEVCVGQASLGIGTESNQHSDLYIPTGHIPDVLKGTVRNLSAGCYSFNDILDFAAHHVVYTGEARAVEQQLRAPAVTVREFLRARYGVACGPSERGDRSDLKRFRLWLADARWRIQRMRTAERLRRAVQLQRAWRAPAMVM